MGKAGWNIWPGRLRAKFLLQPQAACSVSVQSRRSATHLQGATQHDRMGLHGVQTRSAWRPPAMGRLCSGRRTPVNRAAPLNGKGSMVSMGWSPTANNCATAIRISRALWVVVSGKELEMTGYPLKVGQPSARYASCRSKRKDPCWHQGMRPFAGRESARHRSACRR